MLTEAAWKPRSRRIGEFMVSLARGELVASIRHLMRTWSWSQGKVDRFISRLKNETMVDTRTDTGITIITICNYNKYQIGGMEVDTETDTEADTQTGQGRIRGRDRDGYNTEALKHLNNETVEDGAIAPAKKVRRRQAREETSLPADFSLDDKNIEIAAAHGFVGANAIRLFDKFTSSARAKGRKYVDWRAAWRLWCSNQQQWDAERQVQSPQKRVPRL